ncbi:MAG: asparagine synthase-related protein, partial [Acidiferrobacterales bacterium]
YDHPYGNASAVPTYYCARLARDDGVDTLLAGDGGDELFGGNVRYARQWLFSLYSDLPAVLRKRLIQPLLFGIPAGDKIWPVRKLQSYIRQASLPMPERLETYNFLSWIDVDRIFHKHFLEQVDQGHPLKTLTEIYDGVHADGMLNKMLGLDLKITLADNDLPKVTRMCEFAGLQACFPLLDDDLVAFSARLPAELKLRRTQLRYFFKKALEDFLPQETLKKSKHGFGLPFGPWLVNHRILSDLVHDNLRDLAARRIVRSEFIQELIDARLAVHSGYYGTLIWVLVMLEEWFKHHID